MGIKSAKKTTPTLCLSRPFYKKAGNCWICRLPPQMEDDGDRSGTVRSEWSLLEDGLPLPLPHAQHDDIIAYGGGRYSHWYQTLYFSASDNSDPNTNERKYELRWDGDGERDPLFLSEGRDEMELNSSHSVQTCAGVFALIGSSFCGSTLVNAVLGCHPRIFGGGELEALIRRNDTPTECAICGWACPYWTKESKSSISAENFYDRISKIFNRPYIVDASKAPWCFDAVLPHFPDLRVLRVLMVKHPVRHVASIVEKGAWAGPAPDGHTYSTWERALFGLRHFYEALYLPNEDTSMVPAKYYTSGPRWQIDLIIRYEDFVASPAKTLEPILGWFGLEYDTRMDLWAEAEHHHIGGNVGPRVQIANHQPVLATAKKKYLQSGIFLDNSYSDILDLDTIEKILDHPDALWLRERFGYPGKSGL